MDYKLVCIDLDGTLLNSDHCISSYNAEVIKEVRKTGAVIAIVTGRRYKSSYKYATELELDVPLICYNGGMIVDQNTKKIIHKSTLSKDYAKQVIRAWAKTGAPTFAYAATFDDPDVYNQNSGDHPSIKRYFDYEQRAILSIDNLAEELSFNPLCVKTFGWDTDIEKCDLLKSELISDDIIWLKTKGPGNAAYLEVFPNTARKSFGLQWLCQHYDITQEQVLAIGDNLNDIDMLEWAGCGVAMGNALPEVKKVADFTTDEANNNGVGKILEKLMLS